MIVHTELSDNYECTTRNKNNEKLAIDDQKPILRGYALFQWHSKSVGNYGLFS